MPTKPINKGFLSYRGLFKLNRCRWFPRAIVHYSIYMLHFIYNSAGCSSDDIPRNLSAFCSHEICSGYCTQCDGVVVCSFITHNTYGTHVGQRCKVLVYFFVQSGFGDFFAPDGVCVLYHLYFFCGYIADDTDTKSWTREWLTEY